MNEYGEILIRLGRIEGELIAIRKLAERVSRLERWQYWMKGAWAALSAPGFICAGRGLASDRRSDPLPALRARLSPCIRGRVENKRQKGSARS